jgi:hypothetical protein
VRFLCCGGQSTWCEVEECGVEVEGREGARGDDDRLEALEHRLDRQRRVQARQLQNYTRFRKTFKARERE